MKKPKSYRTSSPLPMGALAPHSNWEVSPDGNAKFELDVSATSHRKVDYGDYLGLGFDAWVWAGLKALNWFMDSGVHARKSVYNYATNGWLRWLEFMRESNGPSEPNGLSSMHVADFVKWLKRKYPFRSSAHTTYAQVKAMLMAISNLELGLEDTEMLFPKKPFISRAHSRLSPKALSAAEVSRLAKALKSDLVAIHRGEFTGPESQALVVPFLVIALRTGINPTPLLEATRDCLSPNPISPNMMVLRTFKRRGKGHQTNTMRQTIQEPGTTVVPMDGVAVLQGVITRTEQLSMVAPSKIQNRIWLYRSRSMRAKGALLALSDSGLNIGIRKFAVRHGLLGDDGLPMIPSPSRLRKTVEAKLWKLSDGDLIAVAAAIGHTPDVADQHYLRLTDEMKVDAARFVGLALPEILRGDLAVQPIMPVSIRKTVQNTPVGRCASSLDGKLSPKNGLDHCERFSECLTCPTFVVVGSVKDLHRLFSFQLFLQYDAHSIDGGQ